VYFRKFGKEPVLEHVQGGVEKDLELELEVLAEAAVEVVEGPEGEAENVQMVCAQILQKFVRERRELWSGHSDPDNSRSSMDKNISSDRGQIPATGT
jgi:hypothetical protein